MRKRFLCKMLNHCSIWFIQKQCDFQEVADEAGMSREPGLNVFALLDAGTYDKSSLSQLSQSTARVVVTRGTSATQTFFQWNHHNHHNGCATRFCKEGEAGETKQRKRDPSVSMVLPGCKRAR